MSKEDKVKKLRFLIHHINEYGDEDDSIIVEGDTDEELMENSKREISKRNWNENNLWSSEIK